MQKGALNSSVNGSTDESDRDDVNESELIEMPYFLRRIFDWLLDHHAVSLFKCISFGGEWCI